MLNQFRRESDVLREDCDVLMNCLIAQLDESLIDVQDEVYADYKKLKADITQQRFQR